MAKADAPVEVVNETTAIVEKTVTSNDAKQVIYLGPKQLLNQVFSTGYRLY